MRDFFPSPSEMPLCPSPVFHVTPRFSHQQAVLLLAQNKKDVAARLKKECLQHRQTNSSEFLPLSEVSQSFPVPYCSAFLDSSNVLI